MKFRGFINVAIFCLTTIVAPWALAEDQSVQPGEWLKRQLSSGLEADFGQMCKSKDDKICRRIDAAALRDALREKVSDSDQQVIIKGAVIAGTLDLSGLSISRRVSFVQCTFEGRANFTGADFAGDLLIDGAVFSQGIDADNLHVGGQLFIRNHTAVSGGSFDLTNSYIKSDLSIADSDFAKLLVLDRSNIGTKLLIQTSTFHSGIRADFMDVAGSLNLGPKIIISGGPASFKAASVGERLDFIDSHVLTSSNFVDMNIKGNVLFHRDILDGDADISGSQIQGDLRLKEETDRGAFVAQRLRIGGSFVIADNTHLFQMVDLNDSSISEDFAVHKTDLGGRVSIKRARVSGSVNFELDTIEGSVDLTDASIGIDLNLINTNIACRERDNDDVDGGAFLAKGARVGGNIYLGPLLDEKAGGINLVEVRVDGNIEVMKSIFSSDFLVPLAHVGQSIFIHETTFRKDILMNGSTITQHLDLAGNRLGSIDLNRSNIGGDFRIVADPHHKYSIPTQFKKSAVLNLSNAKIGLIQDENENKLSAAPWPNQIDLQGLEYGSFGDARNLNWANSWLAKQLKKPEADSRGTLVQPYKSLAAYFKNIGDDKTGDSLLVEAREKEKELYRSSCQVGHMQGLSSCLGFAEMNAWGMIDYGVGSWQIKTLLYILCFVLAGVVVLGQSPYARDRGLGWRFGASLNRLIPVLDLREEFKNFFEKPNDLKSWHVQYFYIHAIAGFMLASFVLAALTGLIQSK